MNNGIIVLAIGITLIISGCSSPKPRDITLVTDKIDVCSKPPKADKIIMRNVDFKIIKDDLGIYWIAVTPRFYENLSVNMKEIMQHIKQKTAIVKYYKTCVEKKPKQKDVK